LPKLGFGRLFKGKLQSPEDLGKLVDRKADGWEDELLGVFESKDGMLRAEAARLAVHLPVDKAKEGLIGLLRDPDQSVVLASLHSIGDLRIESALPAVSGLLSKRSRAA
jgi:HEAT repeat protein